VFTDLYIFIFLTTVAVLVRSAEDDATWCFAECLLLLRIALGLPQGAPADVLMHTAVYLDHHVRPLAEEPRQKPLHQTVAPVWRARKGDVLRTARAANFAQRSPDKLLRVGDEGRRLADFGHGGGDEMRLDALDVDAVGLQLGAERRGPLLQEGLAAGVGCEERCGEEATERGHGKDETALAGDHAGGDNLRDAQSGHAVDYDDVVHFLLGCLNKGHGDVVAQADVVDQDGHVKAVNELAEAGVVGVLVERKVHGQRLDGDLGAIFGRDVGGERVELGLGARDEDQVVALRGEGEGKLLANAVRGAGDEGPGAAGAKGGELGVLGGD
jgi:hypothetical protein